MKPRYLRTVVLSFLFTIFFCAGEIIAQCGKTKIGTPAGLLAVLQQKCEKWSFDLYQDQASQQIYKDTFPNNCDDSYGNLTCYWNNAVTACKGLVASESKIHPLSPWTYVKTLPSTVRDATIVRCVYKVMGINTLFDDHVVRFGTVLNNPRQSHCEIGINGPYRNCSDQFTLCGTSYTDGQRGFDYTQTQKNKVKATNIAKYGTLTSDLAGFIYPKSSLPNGELCLLVDPNDSNNCMEPESLPGAPNALNSGEVHHVVPRKDRQGCACGRNSMRNAAVISRQLNKVLLNFKRPQAEITAINSLGQNPYSCASNIAPLRAVKPKRKNVRSWRNLKR